jgi:hypothetical protein
MLPTVLPIRMILFQSLFLMIAIAIEATVFRQNLNLPPRKSVQYAASINFLATVVGWFLFLNIQSILPANLKLALLSFIFFDQWSREILPWFILAALITFFVSLMVKWVSLQQLQFFLGDQQEKDSKEEKNIKTLKTAMYRRTLKTAQGVPRQTNAVLVANALSYSAISIVLFLRLLAQGSLGNSLQ